MSALPAWPYPRWIAHRGAGRLAPENTLAAFRLGRQRGWRMAECDVTLSADGMPFLLHDARLDRTTNGHGLACVQAWSQLALLDAGSWHGAAYAGEPLPTLAMLATLAQTEDILLNLELKPGPGDDERCGRIAAAEAQRLWAGAGAPPLLSSFSPAALAAARAAAPALPRAHLFERLQGDWIGAALGLGCVAVVAEWRALDDGQIGLAHQAGLRVLSYTVNDAALAERLIAAGIDGLISDAVDRFTP